MLGVFVVFCGVWVLFFSTKFISQAAISDQDTAKQEKKNPL